MTKLRMIVAAVGILAGVVILYVLSTFHEDKILEDGIVAFKTGNYGQAMSQLKPLAERGNQAAMLLMGIAYAHGYDGAKDRSRAQKLILDSDPPGASEHFYGIAQRFERGDQTEKNDEEAFAWYLIAGQYGHRRSQEILSEAYRTGKFSQEINPSKAAYWQEKLTQGSSKH